MDLPHRHCAILIIADISRVSLVCVCGHGSGSNVFNLIGIGRSCMQRADHE